mmetsp:Transcript_94890/g.251984  ORF Transcript_94890/g.251984 Transcript_94890/m.251984 type:complete len:240 (+) Transcript_94890:548-1267(+)
MLQSEAVRLHGSHHQGPVRTQVCGDVLQGEPVGAHASERDLRVTAELPAGRAQRRAAAPEDRRENHLAVAPQVLRGKLQCFPVRSHCGEHDLPVPSEPVRGVLQREAAAADRGQDYLAVALQGLCGKLQGPAVALLHGCQDDLAVALELLWHLLQRFAVGLHDSHDEVAVALPPVGHMAESPVEDDLLVALETQVRLSDHAAVDHNCSTEGLPASGQILSGVLEDAAVLHDGPEHPSVP